MKLLQLTKIATIASLLALSNISCAADPVKSDTKKNPTYDRGPTTSEGTAIPAPSFKVGADGSIVPVSRTGKPFVEPVIINKMETTTITQITHTGSPTCLLYCIQLPGGFPQKCFFDPSVPQCATLNK
jgi:hypothetical protein